MTRCNRGVIVSASPAVTRLCRLELGHAGSHVMVLRGEEIPFDDPPPRYPATGEGK